MSKIERPVRKLPAGPDVESEVENLNFVNINESLEIKDDDSNHTENKPALKDEFLIEGKLHMENVMHGNKEILCIKYAENFDYIAAGGIDGIVCLFETNTYQKEKELFDQEICSKKCPVTSIKHRPPNKSHPQTDCIICTYVTAGIKCWNYNFMQCVYTIPENRQTLGLAYHHRLPKFITYGDDNKLYLYDEETKTLEQSYHASGAHNLMDGHQSRVFSASFNPKSLYEFTSGGWDDTVQFWDSRVPNAIRYISGPHICGEGVEISKTGREVLTCAWQKDNPLQLWDYGSGKLIANLEPDIHMSLLYCGKFIERDLLACGGADLNLMRVVNLRSYTTYGLIRGLSKAVYSLDIGLNKHLKKSERVIKVAFCSGCNIYEANVV